MRLVAVTSTCPRGRGQRGPSAAAEARARFRPSAGADWAGAGAAGGAAAMDLFGDLPEPGAAAGEAATRSGPRCPSGLPGPGPWPHLAGCRAWCGSAVGSAAPRTARPPPQGA